MTKRYSKLNFRALLLFLLIAIVVVAGFTSCKKRNQLPVSDFNIEVDAPTGLIDDDGNVFVFTNYVTNYVTNNTYKRVIITNRTYFPDKIIYMTNTVTVTNMGKVDVITEYVYVDKVITNTIIQTNVVPDLKNYISRWHNSFMYKVYAPWSGIGAEGDYKYTNLSYLDAKTLSEMWGRVVKMKSHSGQELTIRNRTTGTYFYFDDNLNVRWSKRPNEILKEFVQGLIIQHRCGNDTKGAYAIAGLYRLTKDTSELRTWNDTGINILQGELFRWTRYKGEVEILVVNPGHVIDGKEYGFEIYNYYDPYHGMNSGNTRMYLEERPESYMGKLTVIEAWKNWRPFELHDLTFQITKR